MSAMVAGSAPCGRARPAGAGSARPRSPSTRPRAVVLRRSTHPAPKEVAAAAAPSSSSASPPAAANALRRAAPTTSPLGSRAAALLCATTILVESLSPAGAALAAAAAAGPPNSRNTTTAAAAQHHHRAAPDAARDPLRAFLEGVLGGGRRREAERLEQERREAEEARARAEAEAAAAAAAAAKKPRGLSRLWGGGGGGGGGGGRAPKAAASTEKQQQQQQPLTAADVAELLDLDEGTAERVLAEGLPPSARALTPAQARRRLELLGGVLRLGPASARSVAASAPALLALEPAQLRARVERELPELLGVPRDRAVEAARSDPGLILAGTRFEEEEEEEDKQGGGDASAAAAATTTTKKKQPPAPPIAALQARLRALAALLEVPEPVARLVAAQSPGLLALPRGDLAERLVLLGRLLSEPERGATQAAAEAALAREQQELRGDGAGGGGGDAPAPERRSRARARQRLQEQALGARRRDAASRLPQLSDEGLSRARSAALECPSLLVLAGRPTALRLRAREAAGLLGLSAEQLAEAVAREGGSALLAQPSAVTRARLLALGLALDASSADAADAVALAPALVAVPRAELERRLDAVARTLKVPLPRARTLALERPSLLARDADTIRAAGELVSQAAARAGRGRR